MRLFLAIDLPNDVRRHAGRVQAALRPRLGKASLPREQNLHVTLKFLGELPDADVAALCEALRAVPTWSPVSLHASGVKCFPPRGPVRVVTLGLDGDVETLRALHADVETACFERGLPREGRRYTPHVTLARARNPLPPAARETLAELVSPHLPGPQWSADEFVLMQSELKPQGAEYAVVARFPFANPQ